MKTLITTSIVAVAFTVAGCSTTTHNPQYWQPDYKESHGDSASWHNAKSGCARDLPYRADGSPIPRERSQGFIAIPWTYETQPAFVDCMSEYGWKLTAKQ